MMGTSLFRVANSGLGRYTAAKWTDWIVTRRTTTTGSGRPPAVGGSRWATRPSSRHYTSKSGGDGRRDDRMVEEDEEDNLFEDSVGFMEEDPDQDDFELDESMGMKSMDDKVIKENNPKDSDSVEPVPLAIRPRLPKSMKKLNKLLSRHVVHAVPEHELRETFVRGSGPGGQAINKLSTAVSLVHIPTGIRVHAQPTRSREQNRTAARHVLRDKLDDLRAKGLCYNPDTTARETSGHDGTTVEATGVEEVDGGVGEGMVLANAARKAIKRAQEQELAGMYSKSELRAAKIRARKEDRARKHRKKKRLKEEAATAAASSEAGDKGTG